jgi:acetylornithine deacetylase/succinyl-diaminopimelate desuccinylase-like protein
MRLVPDQNPLEIADLFTAYMMQVAPPSLNVEVNIINSGSPAITPLDRPEIEAAASAYEMVWGVGPVYSREGGSIPVVATFQEELGIPVVLMGFGLAQDQVHAPNERYRVDHFHKGIEALIHYYYNVSEIDRGG